MIKAPYNFVPLAQTVVFPDWAEKISMDIPFKDGISGTIDVKYTAQTPVFIGNGKEKDTTVVKNYKAANGQYALPGSSLRGMLRNVIEIASFGKFCRIDNVIKGFRDLANSRYKSEMTSGKDTVKAKSKSGWLVFEDKEWKLYPVKHFRVEDEKLMKIYPSEKVKKGSKEVHLNIQSTNKGEKRREFCNGKFKVYFTAGPEEPHKHHFDQNLHGNLYLIYSSVDNISLEPIKGGKTGYIVLTGKVGRKHMDFVFEEKNNSIVLDKKVLENFKVANNPDAKNMQEGIDLTEELKKYKGCPGIPVFYLEDSNGNIESLGLSQMFRLPYKYSTHDAIEHSSPEHLNDAKMDLPECIFGKIDNNKTSLRGRVQFEDAVGNNVSLDQMITTILGNPKPSFYPNYIEQNPPKYDEKGRPDYTTLMDDDVRLRGWKRYPVRNETNPLMPENEQKQQQQKYMEVSQQKNSDKKQNSQEKIITQFSPLKKDSVFEGKIHFHNLKPEELGALLWAITWNNKKELSHSIGMGKPYGFGQIKAEIKSLSYLENSIISNDYAKADAEKISTWQNEFSTYMESNINGWKNSSQLKELFAMANPDNAKRQNWNLEHMKLRNPHEFVDAKNSKEYLAPYSQNNQSLSLGGGGNNFGNRNGNHNQSKKTDYQAKSEGGVVQGQTYPCILLEEKTKKGGWKAKLKSNEGIGGSITNSPQVPADKKPGDEVNLKIRSLNGSNTSFDFVS